MTTPLSGVAIIIFIAIGFTTFVLLFIFGKRQIMRFALKSRRGPHFPIASDAPKHLRKEIERRLDVVKDIRTDPLLLPEDEDPLSQREAGIAVPDHVFRMKAVDSLKLLEQEIVSATDASKRRPAGQDVRFYLQRLARSESNGPLDSSDPQVLNSFIDSYLHARHDARPFGLNEYKSHVTALQHLRQAVKSKGSKGEKQNNEKNNDKNETNGVTVSRRNVFVVSDSPSPRVTLMDGTEGSDRGSKRLSESAV